MICLAGFSNDNEQRSEFYIFVVSFIIVSFAKVLISCVVVDNIARISGVASEIPGLIITRPWFWAVNLLVAAGLTARMSFFADTGFGLHDYLAISLDMVGFIYLVMRDRYPDDIKNRTMGQRTKQH